MHCKRWTAYNKICKTFKKKTSTSPIVSYFFKYIDYKYCFSVSYFCNRTLWSDIVKVFLKSPRWSMLRFFFMNIQIYHAIDMIFSSSLHTFIKIPFGLSVSIILISYISHGGWLTLLVQKFFNFDLCSPMSFTGTWKIYLNLNNISPHVLGTYVFMINNFLSPLFVDLDQGHVIRLIKLIHKVKHDGVFFINIVVQKIAN